MNSTKPLRTIEVGDIVQYSDLTPWEDVKIIAVNRWKFDGVDYASYNVRFVSDDFVIIDVDPSFLRQKR